MSASATHVPVELSVIVISHGHEAVLPACIDSLEAPLDGIATEIIAIDNLPDGSVRRALEGRPVRVVANTAPVGFSANVNRGVALARGDVVLILNPDTRHASGALRRSLDRLTVNPSIGILSCTLLNPDGTPQQNYRRFPSPFFLAMRGLGADHWPWRPAYYRRLLMETIRGDSPFEVDWVFGAFLLMRRELFLRLGGMDEGFRLYYEDVDLAWRVREAGLTVVVDPGIAFIHQHIRASASGMFGQMWRWHVASSARYFCKRGLRSFRV